MLLSIDNALSDIYKVHSKMQLHKFLGKNAFYRINNVFDMYCIENSDSIIIKTYQRKVREMKKGWMCSDENEIKLLTMLNTN